MFFRMTFLGAFTILCACQETKVPSQFIGTWGQECDSPFVQFDIDGTMRIYPKLSERGYKPTTVVADGKNLTVSFNDALAGETTDVYALEGDQLHLIKTIQNHREKIWQRRVMKKCA